MLFLLCIHQFTWLRQLGVVTTTHSRRGYKNFASSSWKFFHIVTKRKLHNYENSFFFLFLIFIFWVVRKRSKRTIGTSLPVLFCICLIWIFCMIQSLHFLCEQKTKQKSHRRIFTSLIPYRSEAVNPLTSSLRSLERNGFIDFILGTPWRRKAEAGEPPELDAEWTIPML